MNERLKNRHFIKHINPNNAVNIYDFAINAKKLTFEEKDILVKNICESKNYYYIVKFIEEIEWLNKGNMYDLVKIIADSKDIRYIESVITCDGLKQEYINILVDSICKSKQYEKFYYYANKIKNLGRENLLKFVKTISDSKSAVHIYNYAYTVQELSLVEQNMLVYGIINTEDYSKICAFAENIPWLTNKHIDLLTNAISKTNDSYNIMQFAYSVANLTKENLDTLTHAISKTGDAENIYHFADVTINLTKENLDTLTKAIIETKDPIFISALAREVSNLSDENIKDLTNAIIETNDSKYIYDFLIRVKRVEQDDCKILLDKIFELKSFDVIKELISDYIVGVYVDKIGTDFEKRIMETKDLFIIAYYLFRKKDNKLIRKIFGTKEKFLVFILLYRDILDLREKDISKLQDSYNVKYVDDRLNLYVGNSKTIKK